MEDEMICCPDCGFVFMVIWNNWALGPPGGFCPYCGEDFNYMEHLE